MDMFYLLDRRERLNVSGLDNLDGRGKRYAMASDVASSNSICCPLTIGNQPSRFRKTRNIFSSALPAKNGSYISILRRHTCALQRTRSNRPVRWTSAFCSPPFVLSSVPALIRLAIPGRFIVRLRIVRAGPHILIPIKGTNAFNDTGFNRCRLRITIFSEAESLASSIRHSQGIQELPLYQPATGLCAISAEA
jgi:hypothetical protein